MNATKKSFVDNGYVRVLVPLKEQNGKKYAMQHRLVMEKHLGRKLRKNEVVHHKNHDRSDNRISNLQVMTYAEHTRHHARKKNGRWSINHDKCVVCGLTEFKHHVRGACAGCRRNAPGSPTRKSRINVSKD